MDHPTQSSSSVRGTDHSTANQPLLEGPVGPLGRTPLGVELLWVRTPLVRKEVIDAQGAPGVNRAHCSTQYQRWNRARNAVAA